MPQQLSMTHDARARASSTRVRASLVRRIAQAAALSLLACACVPAQSAPSPPTKRPGALLKSSGSKTAAGTTGSETDTVREQPVEPLEKPPASAGGTRARRTTTTSDTATTTPASSTSPASASSSSSTVPASPVAPKTAAKSETAKRAQEGVEGELEILREEIESAKSDAERARLERVLVERLVALGRNADALAGLRLMLHADRFDPPYFFNLGNTLARLDDDSAAADAYRKAISQRRGHYARALNNLGVVLIRQGHLEEARQTLAAALLQENNAYAEASYNLGRLHLLDGETELAIREWQRTLRLAPDHAEAAAALARAYQETGDPKRALAVIEAFTDRATRTGSSVPREIDAARRELSEADVPARPTP